MSLNPTVSLSTSMKSFPLPSLQCLFVEVSMKFILLVQQLAQWDLTFSCSCSDPITGTKVVLNVFFKKNYRKHPAKRERFPCKQVKIRASKSEEKTLSWRGNGLHSHIPSFSSESEDSMKQVNKGNTASLRTNWNRLSICLLDYGVELICSLLRASDKSWHVH